MGVRDGINRKHKTSVEKRNIKLRQNKKNRVEKQQAAPQFTSKLISKKKQRLLNKGKGDKLHARQLRVKASHKMETETQDDEVAAEEKMGN